MKTRVLCAPCVLLAAALGAQEKAEQPRSQVIPLRVQVVFTKTLGEKKIASLPYTLTVNAGESRPAHVRMGIEVPVVVQGRDAPAPPQVQYKNVGTNLDCSAEALGDGRFKLSMGIEQSSIYSTDGESRPESWAVGETPLGRMPLFRSFRTQFNPVLRDGQSAQYTAATDPVSGEVVRIDVTLNVIKER